MFLLMPLVVRKVLCFLKALLVVGLSDVNLSKIKLGFLLNLFVEILVMGESREEFFTRFSVHYRC